MQLGTGARIGLRLFWADAGHGMVLRRQLGYSERTWCAAQAASHKSMHGLSAQQATVTPDASSCAGTGKTLLARAVANRTDACFIRVIGSELVQKYVGEGARMVRELFQV